MPNPYISGIVQISISAVMLSSVYIATIKGTNTTTWTASEVAMWGMLTIVGIIGMLYGTLNIFGIV